MNRSKNLFKRRQWLFPILILLMGAMFSTSVPAVSAAVTTSNNCAVTPGTLGQGFSVSGLGFSVSGLGFSVSGLGFSVSGLGFSVSGLGIDPLQVASEIRNNSITSAWLANLLPGIEGGPNYNSTKTAILIVDDQTHGDQVEAVFNALLPVSASNIKLVRVNVSDSSTNYNADLIAARIQSKINQLKTEGYKHFVINMSFGLVPCDDPGPVLGGKQYPWNFNEMVNWVTQQNEAPTPAAIAPILECTYPNGDGTTTAQFGYRNDNAYPVTVAIGADNNFDRPDKDQGQPILFEPGRAYSAFSVVFSGSKLTWKIKGPDGVSRFAAAYPVSFTMGTLCGNPGAPTKTIYLDVNCVADNGNGTYTARFGYRNGNPGTVIIKPGAHNSFSPALPDGVLPTHFLTGQNTRVFSVVFDGSPITWTVKSPNGTTKSAVASASSTPCVDDTSTGLNDYAQKVLKIPKELVDDYFDYLLNAASDDLIGLRLLLQNYLVESRNSGGNFQVFPVAASGNFRPWLGAEPLAPARWAETIAVSASVGNNGALWQFAHNGNVKAPGVGFEISPNNYIGGTSFAAPFVSTYLANWATYPNACSFPLVAGVVRPPLVHPDTFGNSPVSLYQPSEFTCTKPAEEPVELVTCYASFVVDYIPGVRKNGSAIPEPRRNPAKALGPVEPNDTNHFVALGFDKPGTSIREGVLILGFDNKIVNIEGADFRVWETAFGNTSDPWSNYPEAVEVYASTDGSSWTYLGTTTDNDQAYDLGSLPYAYYIKLVDVTDKAAFNDNAADGFDVDGIEGFGCEPGDSGGSELVSLNHARKTNALPVARAGEDLIAIDKNGKGSKKVQLDASSSYDPDGKIVSYAWSLPGYEIEAVAMPQVRLPVGTHEITLTITDKKGNVSTDTVTVIVQSILPLPPSALTGSK